MAQRRIEYVLLSALVPAVRNPKAHDLVALRASFARFGFTEPIVHDGRTDRLVSGHGRLEELRALEALGEKPDDWPALSPWPPEGITATKDGRWKVPVVRGWSSKDDDEAAAFLVAANRITEAGGWHDRELADLLQELSEVAGLDGTGYSTEDLELLLAELAEKPEPTPPGEFPSYGEDIETEHECPRCGYSWSGSSGAKPKEPVEAAAGGE